MPYQNVKRFGETESIAESAVGLVVKTRQANKDMAADVDGRKLIKAGTLYTNPDKATDIGVFFEDVDMTDYTSKPVAVVVAGRLKKNKLGSTAQAKADDFKAQGLYLI